MLRQPAFELGTEVSRIFAVSSRRRDATPNFIRYTYEIQRLDEERKSLKLEKEKLSEAFESKLWRAQTLYDTELNAAKSLYSNELDALKEHESALRDELLGR